MKKITLNIIRSVALITQLFIFVPAITILEASHLPQKYHYNFELPIYESYLHQLLPHTEPLSAIPESIKILMRNPGDTNEARRAAHNTIITTLRELIKSGASSPEINYFSKLLYTEARLLSHYTDFLTHYIDLGDQFISNRPLSVVMQDHRSTLDSVKAFNGKHEATTKTDLQLHGFLPYQLYDSNHTTFLYFPRSVIKEKNPRSREINPIFLAYLRQLKMENKKHLYVNLTNRMSSELEEILPIEELANSEEFKNTLFVVTLFRDGDFYWQEGKWTNKSDVTEFKNELIKTFLNNNFCYWPQSINEQKWNEVISTIVEKVHLYYFDNASNLNESQREGYIELASLFIIEELRNIIKPDYENASCAYTMDRGPGFHALEYVHEMLKNNSFNTEERRKFLTMILAPPIVSHLRPSHSYRIDRLAIALDLLFERPLNAKRDSGFEASIENSQAKHDRSFGVPIQN